MMLFNSLCSRTRCYCCINLRCLNTGVAKHHLNRAQIRAALKQCGRTPVAELVRVETLDPGVDESTVSAAGTTTYTDTVTLSAGTRRFLRLKITAP